MIFAVAPPGIYTNDFTAPLVREYSDLGEDALSVTDIFEIREIRLGDTCYALRRSVKVLPTLMVNNRWVCRLQGCGELVGTGQNRTEAFQNLQEVYHAAFQRLYSMRLFEMNEEDVRIWSFLTGITDVA